MAGWISSKLKVAENFLQQIDQQAAESLGKQEKPRSDDASTSIHKQIGAAPFQEQFKKKTLETPNSFDTLQTNFQAEKHPRVQRLQGLKKPTPTALHQEAPLQEASAKSPLVARPLPILGNDDWTELLASPELISRGSSVGSSDYAGNGSATGKTLFLGGKDAHSNGVSNVRMSSVASASKHATSNSSRSKLPRSTRQLDGSASQRPPNSNKNARHDNKLRQHLEPDSISKVNQYGVQDVTFMRDASLRTMKQINEADIPDSSSSVPGSESDSSSAEISMCQHALENRQQKSDGEFRADKDVLQSKGSLLSDNKISLLDAKDGSLKRAGSFEVLSEAPLKTAGKPYIEISHEISLTSKAADSSSQHGGGNKYQGLQESEAIVEQEDAKSNISIDYDGQHDNVDSNGISREATNKEVASILMDGGCGQYLRNGESIKFAADFSESQVARVQRNSKIDEVTSECKLDGAHVSSSESDERTETDIDSTSGSDSGDEEVERHKQAQRKKREEQMAAEAAAVEAAKAAVKERKEFVMKLEREKESLEHMLTEREEQQAREAAELQTKMMEAMQAVDLEKQKHNNTRMEALARAAKLETENAELAKSLAAVQRNLEVELGRVAEIRQGIESKEVAQAELERRLSQIRHKLSHSDQLEVSRGVESEQERYEEEDSHICQMIEQLQAEVKQLEANIGRTREAWEGPTEVEVELESRLSQLTDHLIQKQAQVEALSSEKATLLFRLEAISNALFEERSMAQSHTRKGNKTAVLLDSVSLEDDLEFGLSRPYDSRNKGINEEHDDFGGHPIVFILRQLDTIFSAGAYYLRRHGLAQLCALIYLVALHIWVMFVLFSHSQETEDVKPGALLSLESINNTTNLLNSTQK